MASEVYQYRIKCTNGDIHITDYLTDPPTTCLDGYSVNAELTTIVESVKSETVSIKDDDGNTQGYYRATGYSMDVTGPTGSISEFEIGFNYPVMIYAVTLLPKTDNILDYITCLAATHTKAGVILSQVDGVTGPTGTTMSVNPTVTNNVKVGWLAHLRDGPTGTLEDIGEIIKVNSPTGTIKTSVGPTGTFASMSDFLISVPRFVDIPLMSDHPIAMGMATAGGSYAPPSVRLKIKYYNHDGKDKTFCFIIEIKY